MLLEGPTFAMPASTGNQPARFARRVAGTQQGTTTGHHGQDAARLGAAPKTGSPPISGGGTVPQAQRMGVPSRFSARFSARFLESRSATRVGCGSGGGFGFGAGFAFRLGGRSADG
jgi:hypothetical protein